MPESPFSPEQLTRLHNQLDRAFNRAELKLLAFELGVDYENFPQAGKRSELMEFIAYLARVQRIPELAQRAAHHRPMYEWQAWLAPPQNPPHPTTDERAALADTLTMARRSLNALEKKAAAHTSLSRPVELSIALEDKRAEVAQLEARLRELGG